MSAKKQHEICGRCKLAIQTTKDPKQCEVCTNFFHTNCRKFHSVSIQSRPTLACNTCAAEHLKANSQPSLNYSVNAGARRSNQQKLPSQTQKQRCSSSSAPPSLNPSRQASPTRAANVSRSAGIESTLQDIVDRLTIIQQQQEEALESNRRVTARVSEIEQRLDSLDIVLKAVDELPQMDARILKTENSIATLQLQIDKLSSGNTTTKQPAIHHPSGLNNAGPADIAHLTRQLEEIKRQQAASSTSGVVVLTGLKYNHTTSLRLLAFAVLSTLDPTVIKRDIVSARVMGRLDAAINNSAADSKMPSLAVTLSSHALVRSTIAAKIKKGKLHSAELCTALLEEANAPVLDGLININELLPTKTHKLRVRARLEARRRGCRSYVRDGKIFIRAGADNTRARVIDTDEELEDFLAKLPTRTQPQTQAHTQTHTQDTQD